MNIGHGGKKGIDYVNISGHSGLREDNCNTGRSLTICRESRANTKRNALCLLGFAGQAIVAQLK